jgi:putative nucleotidyltransferase with HDIG domain
MEQTLKSLIEKVDKLPTLPVIAQEIMRLADNQNLSIDKLKDVVGGDPAIMVKIIGLANSAFFRVSGRTTKLDDAIMRIGLNNVKSIAVGVSVMTLLDDGKKSSDYSRLYNHSLSVGLTARSIARSLKMSFAEDILIEGLLHDLGYLVLNKYLPDTHRQIMEKLDHEQSILDAERNVIQNTHADVGFWLAEKWKLPDTILDTTLYHHSPSLAQRNEKHIAIVHIADYFAAKNMYSPVDRDPGYILDQSSLDVLALSDKDLKDIEHSICTIYNNSHNANSSASESK